ncbi:response regulator [Undibacterium oligocarboniphilum]|uniref:Response regulator n=1 Tax=Undibacterium oligocarboniphilum TaxID=666702 RepID=A0A850QB15_9BURK|nr:response regulator [Undibacterium oligocarboniphilum]MBC3870849.1 response regulator [Undibacterium oligocarboniphilum]NVO76528.1 response regulator [Undibacterium oligocarboniphilum]
MRVLLVEDDPQLGRATQMGLDLSGYATDWVQTADSARSALRSHDYACVLLDLGLPQADGMVLLRELRQSGFADPVLIVTARDQIPDRIAGLDAGADDFIIKPFDLDELTARIRSACRRAHGRVHEVLRHGALAVNMAARQVSLHGQSVTLTVKEFGILRMLLEHAGQVLTREQLEETLYSWGEEIESNAIQVHIHHLRKKLGKELIRTIHAVGYVIDKTPAGEVQA